MKQLLFSFLLLAILFGCNSQSKKEIQAPVQVELTTSSGTIVIELSDLTPLHRDNFVKLVKEGFFNGMTFHRVVKDFGIQTGDPETKTLPDSSMNAGLGYTIPAEINDSLFHKRGIVLAARDNNPDRASSPSQFFIVQGKIHTDSTLNRAEDRINGWLAEHFFVNDPANKSIRDSLDLAMKTENGEAVARWSDSVRTGARNYAEFERYAIPGSHREVYKTIGGAPHLDQNYTVFGEVTEGMTVVDSIAVAEADSMSVPLSEIRLISARILDR